MDGFAAALQAAERDAGGRGIGTLGEKTLHLALKYYFAPDSSTHEQKIGGFVADAVTEEGVIEVQTRSLWRLKQKLRAFLPCAPVTVVYPVTEETVLICVDENGEVQSRRKSPKHETVWHAMPEIVRLKEFLNDPRFRICPAAVSVVQYYRQKNRSEREKLDRAPLSLNGIYMLGSAEDYLALLPPGIAAEQTAGSLADALHIPMECAAAYLMILRTLGAATVTGRRGRENVVTITI